MKDSFLIPFKVAILSTNTNSFGLRHAILIGKKGDAFEAYPSAYGSTSRHLKQGDVVNVRANASVYGLVMDYTSLGWEMARKLPDAPPEVVAEVWKD